MRRIKIVLGRLIDPLNHVDRIGSIYIADGKILSTTDEPDGFQAALIINAEHKIVCPGIIDLSARLREPGQSQKATIASEIAAAASAGITSLCIPPDTQPPNDSPAVTELIKDKSAACGYPQVFPIGALTQRLEGNELSSMYALKKAGCIAISNAQHPIKNLLIQRRAMEYAATHDLLLIYRPEDYWLKNNGCAHEGIVATRYGLPGIPETAESVALAQCLELVEQTGCKVHMSLLSCTRSVEMLQQAKANGLPVSADVAMHQLHLTENDLQPFDSNYHVLPPFRTEADQQALRQAVADGSIEAICSDHQPHNIDAKLGAFPVTEPGISSLETLLPLMLNLVNDNILTLQQGIRSLTGNPAKILGLNSGTLSVGAPADICIFNPDENWVVDDNTWCSQGKNTPFAGNSMQGRVTHTLQSGRILYELE